MFTDDACTDRVIPSLSLVPCNARAMQQTSCDHKPVILTTTMLVNMHKCGKVMHATTQGAPLAPGRAAGAGGLGLGRGLHRHLRRRGVERGGRGMRHTHPQHGEGTARRRARQRDREGVEERHTTHARTRAHNAHNTHNTKTHACAGSRAGAAANAVVGAGACGGACAGAAAGAGA